MFEFENITSDARENRRLLNLPFTDFCRACLRIGKDISTIFQYCGEKYLPNVIYNISGVKISAQREPDAQICSPCAAAIVSAERIILQCQETEEFLLNERKTKLLTAPEAMRYEERRTDIRKNPKLISAKFKNHISELSDKDSISNPSTNNLLFIYDDNNWTSDKQEINNPSSEVEYLNDNSFSNFLESDFIKRDKYSKHIHYTQKSKPIAEIKPKLKENTAAKETNLSSEFEKQPTYVHRCEYCEFETIVRKNFINHLLLNHDIDDTNIYPCSLCDQKFSWRRLLFRHVEKDHEQLPVEKKFMCHECGKTYTHEIYLVNHRKTQHESERHKCPFPGCNVKFNRVFSLRRHFNNMHSTLKRFYCDMCDRHFSVWDNWRYHMDVVHQNAKISCSKCFSPFRNQNHLQKHMQGEACKNWKFLCRYCKRRFPTHTGWRIHEKSMHLLETQLGKDPLTCNLKKVVKAI